MNKSQIKFWYWHFKIGWESVESGPHSGRPSTRGTPEKCSTSVGCNHKKFVNVNVIKSGDSGYPESIQLCTDFPFFVLCRGIFASPKFRKSTKTIFPKVKGNIEASSKQMILKKAMQQLTLIYK